MACFPRRFAEVAWPCGALLGFRLPRELGLAPCRFSAAPRPANPFPRRNSGAVPRGLCADRAETTIPSATATKSHSSASSAIPAPNRTRPGYRSLQRRGRNAKTRLCRWQARTGRRGMSERRRPAGDRPQAGGASPKGRALITSRSPNQGGRSRWSFEKPWRQQPAARRRRP
jgi:hypothetical protein